jgi:cellulose biosynthesis operon protein BcsF/YhjT
VNGSELLQIIAVGSALTLALAFLLNSFWRQIKGTLQGWLRPRYLKSQGVRRRLSVTPVKSESDE